MPPKIPDAWWQERIRLLALANERQAKQLKELKATVEWLRASRLRDADEREYLRRRVGNLERQQWIPWWRR